MFDGLASETEEASGNSFEVVRRLKALERKAIVLESNQLGKLKEVHANNDKLSAVRIAKAYLAGTAKEVWVPDGRSQERRDIYHAFRFSQFGRREGTLTAGGIHNLLQIQSCNFRLRSTRLAPPCPPYHYVRNSSIFARILESD